MSSSLRRSCRSGWTTRMRSGPTSWTWSARPRSWWRRVGESSSSRMPSGRSGLRAALHPHAATYIETPAETDAILERAPDLCLCIDTGHTVVAGGDPVEQLKRHAGRLAHVHLKDVDAAVLERLRNGEIDMDEAWAEGNFCPFGEGVVPLREFLSRSEVHGLDGYAVLEQDRMAVRVDDLPAVREVEERNLRFVQESLA